MEKMRPFSGGEPDDGASPTDVVGRLIPLVVDLDHDDETLAQAFEVWLLCARDSCREKAKNPIGRRDFEQWKRFRLLAAFNLMYWGKLNGYKYKDPFLANTLRPNEPWVDLTERFRKVTKPLVEFEQSLKALGIVSSRKSECNSSESIPE